MMELPEVRTISKDLKNIILGKEILSVGGNFTDHKFTFYYQNPEKYKDFLIHKKVTSIVERNYYVEIEIEDYKLVLRDGANVRIYHGLQNVPAKSKLLIGFEDDLFLNVTTSMYSFISVFKKNEGMPDDKYYNLELNKIGALDSEFSYAYFQSLKNEDTLKLSLKAFLATEQRILGIGNGVLQDILFYAKLHPKRKLSTLSNQEIEYLYQTIISTLKKMIDEGGRDTEKNIFDENGGYKTILSNKNYKNGCPICHGEIKKENYLGGSIYYCDQCQK